MGVHIGFGGLHESGLDKATSSISGVRRGDLSGDQTTIGPLGIASFELKRRPRQHGNKRLGESAWRHEVAQHPAARSGHGGRLRKPSQ